MKKSILVFISIIALVSIGCENSENTEIEQETYFQIQDWFYKTKSIEDNINSDGEIFKRQTEDKNLRIALNRIQLELDENWKFNNQNLTIKNVSPTQVLIRINTMFSNSINTAIRTEIFYYNSAELLLNPVPIEDVSRINENENFKTIYKKLIWQGDFNKLLNDL